MKILLISHAYVAPENLRKPMLLASYDDLEIGIVRPSRWKTAFNPIVAAGPWPASSDGRIKDARLQTFFSGNAGKYFYQPLALYQTIKNFKPDIIHLEEEPWTPVAFEVVVISILSRAKLLIFTWENLDLKLSFWQRAVEKFVFRNSALIIAGNSEARNRVRGRGFGGGVEVLPQFGVNIEEFKPLDVSDLKFELGLSGFIVGFVGRFVEEKGIRTLLEAMSKLPQDVKLLLVSSSSKLPAEFEDLAKSLGVFKQVRIVSKIPHEELSKYMNLMDVFILPSITTKTWKEQFGRVLIEAMACGVPVIGSSSGAIPEVIGDAGLIVEEKNPEALAAKIESLRSHEGLRQELGEKGHQRVLQNFTFEKIAKETARIYRKL